MAVATSPSSRWLEKIRLPGVQSILTQSPGGNKVKAASHFRYFSESGGRSGRANEGVPGWEDSISGRRRVQAGGYIILHSGCGG